MAHFCATTTMFPPDYLHLLPLELWLACWSLCSLQQLRRISLVCRLFRSLALPLVFKHQKFDVAALGVRVGQRNWMDRVRHLHRTAVRLDRLLEGHAPLVRSWKVAFNNELVPMGRAHPDIWNIHVFDTIYDRITTTFSATLGTYQNVSSLDIHRFNIEATFRNTLLSLPKLEDLTLRECNIVARDGFLSLASLTILSNTGAPPSSDPLQLASPVSLGRLTLNPSIELSPLMAGFGRVVFPRLVHISIDVIREGDVDRLFHFLEQCPRLEYLAIHALQGNPTLPDVHPNTIPLLRTLTGPPKLVQLLTPNHPVSEVRLVAQDPGDNSQNLMPVCMDILRSTIPLRSLTLPVIVPTLEVLVAATGLFPELRELTIIVMGRKRGRCGCGMRRRINAAEIPVDARALDLHDDDAFDNPTTDDISDTESEAPLTVVRTNVYVEPEIAGPSGIRDILRWIFAGQLILPPNIEALRLEPQGRVQQMGLTQQQQAVAALSIMCPLLREVQFGLPDCNWKRAGELWKKRHIVRKRSGAQSLGGHSGHGTESSPALQHI
ncbi:hypothetical protein DFH09DRAFT_451198 [Mycena vulgaris]|nr:hypothetical protein DFH09DRAFT_451198 [Mycena vulgaris]